nr:MAG TPA: hypothetical protein [Caudoviricetes sp.]
MKDDIITLNRGAKELAQGITLENVPLNQYMEFLAVAQDWKKVVAEIAECCVLLQNYENAKEYPEMIIDGNKVIALCMKYAHLGVPESVRKQYGWKEGLPDTTKVRIE